MHPTDAQCLELREATLADVPVLAQMNKHLIEDEASRNRMSPSELECRMRGWLEGEWRGIVVLKSGEVVGYLVFRERPDEYEPARYEVVIRQFFIKWQDRGAGLGKQAFEMAAQRFFPPQATLVLDILETNPRGKQFWEKIGFSPYSTTLRREGTA